MEVPLLSFRRLEEGPGLVARPAESDLAQFRLVRLDCKDAERQSDDLGALRDLLLENQPMYPGIDSWYREKVLPGLKAGQRVGYLGLRKDGVNYLSVDALSRSCFTGARKQP